MAVSAPYQIVGLTITLEAAANLSAKQFYPVKLATGSKVDVCVAQTDRAIGILLNDPIAGQDALIGSFGVYQGILAGNCVPGDRLAPEVTNGRLIVSTTAGNWAVAIALTAGAANEIVPVLVGPFGAIG